MPNEFINPNWHVVFLHIPIGLLSVGVLIELLSFLWPSSSIRPAARWMILLGGLSCIPTALLGLYALRDVVSAQPISDHQTWHQVLNSSPWTDKQWSFMRNHLLAAIAATALTVLASVVWLSSSDQGRRTLRVPVLLALLVGLGLVLTASWFSGEAVYRYGTSIERIPPVSSAAGHADSAASAEQLTTQPTPAGMIEEPQVPSAHSHLAGGAHASADPRGITYYIPPLQLHVLLAGLTIAVAVGALGVTFRRWKLLAASSVTASREAAVVPASSPRVDVHVQPVPTAPPARASLVTSEPRAAAVVVVTPVRPARFWLLAFVLAAATAAAGLWFTQDWRLRTLTTGLESAAVRREIQRLFFHVLFGATIVLLTLLLALVTRATARAKGLTLFIVLLLLLAVAAQVWLGTLLLLDSHSGPVTGLNPPG